MWLFREKNPKRGFYNTPTSLERELLILREKSLQSLLIPFLIVILIERRFAPKYYPHQNVECFWSFEKHWKIPRMADAMDLLWDPVM